MTIKNSKDVLMLLFAAKGHRGQDFEPIEGQTRLMKMVFLFQKEVYQAFKLDRVISAEAFPNFEPYDYGPYSAQVYTDLEFLVDIGLVQVSGDESEPTTEETVEYDYWQASAIADDEESTISAGRIFSATELGKEYINEELRSELSENQWKILHEFKARCTGTSLRSLLRYVYTKYGEMTTKSKIRDEIL